LRCAKVDPTFPNIHREMFNPVLLERVFDLRRDGIVILKVLPEGPAQCAHALLLLLYGYHQFKKERRLAWAFAALKAVECLFLAQLFHHWHLPGTEAIGG
jgi:hypothetical protein